MKNFVQPGNTITAIAPVGGINSGDGMLFGTLFGVAATTQAGGAEVEITLEGVFDLPKATGAISAGALVYWDAVTGEVTTTDTGNVLIGAATEAAASGAATARVRLNGVAIAA